MDQERFNKDMEEYIRKRRRRHDTSDNGIDLSGVWDTLASAFTVEEDVHTIEQDDEEVEQREELTQEEMEQLEEELEDEDVEKEEGVELEVPSPSWTDRLLELLGFGESIEEFEDFEPDEYAKEESERVMFEEDVKEILTIANSWIEKLSDERLRAFKESDDFDRYQELLDKLDLLKKD